MRPRDNQKNKLYAWERSVAAGMYKQTMDLASVDVMVKRIWRSERGRYGLAKTTAPLVRAKHHGAASAGHNHMLSFPKWACNDWVVLHELAHRLTPTGEAHGPRFTGVLIGLVCRHMGQDRDELVNSAIEMGLRIDLRAIGAVPRLHLSAIVAKYLPGTPVGIAVRINIERGTDLSYRQIQGAAMRLVTQKLARWRGPTIVART